MTYKTRAGYLAAVKRAIKRSGKVPFKAIEDPQGNCTYCGEAGRCTGWHYVGEILDRRRGVFIEPGAR